MTLFSEWVVQIHRALRGTNDRYCPVGLAVTDWHHKVFGLSLAAEATVLLEPLIGIHETRHDALPLARFQSFQSQVDGFPGDPRAEDEKLYSRSRRHGRQCCLVRTARV